MIAIDNEGMPMTPARARQMRMVCFEAGMLVFDLVGIARWPDTQGNRQRQPGDERHRREGRGQAQSCAQPTGRRVGDQPAGMREGELGGKQRRPILGMGRAAQRRPDGVWVRL